jgi:nucleotide-binding universal stress UspA family protein
MLGIQHEQLANARRDMENLLSAEKASKVSLQTIVKTGRIEEELLAMIDSEQINLVVMGTHGRRAPARWFIGSVTEHMLRKVPVPVLTVSHPETEQHIIGFVSVKHILYSTDLSESSKTGLNYSIELARTMRARLTVLHVLDYDDRVLWGPAYMSHLPGERAKLLHDLRQKLDEFVARETQPDVQIETELVEGKPFNTILEIAAARHADIIVLNLQSKSVLERAVLGSTAERVVRLARLPVLSIPG